MAPDKLVLTSKSGQPASGFFVLTAANGPVAHYTVRVAALAGRVRVAPAGGSLPVNGYAEVTVTVTSKVALTVTRAGAATSPTRAELDRFLAF